MRLRPLSPSGYSAAAYRILKYAFKTKKCDSRDPISIVAFRTGFADACDKIKLGEGEAYLVLPSLIIGTSFVHYSTR